MSSPKKSVYLVPAGRRRWPDFAKAALTCSVRAALLPILSFACMVSNASAQGPAKSYTLGPSDKVEIRVLGIDELDGKISKIDPEGNIDVPIIGTVKASGLTVDQLQEDLRGRLTRYVIDPKVNVTVTEYRSRPITILGAVNKPGVLENTGTDTLAEVISAAGGLRSDAGNIVVITRPGDAGPLPLPNLRRDPKTGFVTGEVDIRTLLDGHDPTLNCAVLPGDVISVPRADMVYVVGAVRHPTGIMLNERPSMTVMEALSMAEGLEKTAQPKQGRILRSAVNGEHEEMPVNVSSIIAGRRPDIALLPNDILVIPDSTVKRITTRSVEALLTTVSGYVMLH